MHHGTHFDEDTQREISFALATLDGKVVLDLGKPVRWVGMSPTQARQLAKSLRRHADQAQRSR